MLSSLILWIVAAVATALGVWLVLETLRKPAVGVFLLFFFLPFERIPSIDVAGFTLRINHVLGGFLLVLWLALILAGRLRIRSEPMLPLIALFATSLLFSLPLAGNSTRAIFVIGATFFTMSLALLIAQLTTSRGQLHKLMIIIGITTIISLIFGGFQFLGDLVGLPISLTGLDPGYTKDVFGFPRIQAFSQEPLYYGNFLLLPIGLALAFLLVPQKWFPRWLLSLFLVSTVIILGLTLSRGAIIGGIGTILFIIVFLAKRFFTVRNISIVLSGIVVATTLILGGLSIVGPDARAQFIEHLTIQDFGVGESTVGRLSSWYQAIDLWKTSPVVGIGEGNFGPASLGFPAESPPRGWPIVNNEYLELLAETGVIGLLLFFSFIGFLFVRMLRAYPKTRTDPELRAVLVGVAGAVVGTLIQYNFFSTLFINGVWITLGLFMAVLSLIFSEKRA